MGQRLTQEQIDGMCQMRKEGYSIQETADEYGVCIRTVNRYAPYYQQSRAVPVIYPRIDRWLKDNCRSITDLARIARVPIQTLYHNLVGETKMSKPTIDKILASTGLTYEEAFREEERE